MHSGTVFADPFPLPVFAFPLPRLRRPLPCLRHAARLRLPPSPSSPTPSLSSPCCLSWPTPPSPCCPSPKPLTLPCALPQAQGPFPADPGERAGHDRGVPTRLLPRARAPRGCRHGTRAIDVRLRRHAGGRSHCVNAALALPNCPTPAPSDAGAVARGAWPRCAPKGAKARAMGGPQSPECVHGARGHTPGQGSTLTTRPWHAAPCSQAFCRRWPAYTC